MQRLGHAGADEVIDHTTTVVGVGEPVDVLLNLARITPQALFPLTALIRGGGRQIAPFARTRSSAGALRELRSGSSSGRSPGSFPARPVARRPSAVAGTV
jgi:hypothetical protein